MRKILSSEPIKFFNGGVILKIFSFGLNFILADLLALDLELTYIFVLFCDLILGFFINRYFVFNKTKTRKNSQTLTMFFIAGLGFRAMNYFIYIAILNYFKLYLLIAQLIATLIVLVLKFFVYRKIFN